MADPLTKIAAWYDQPGKDARKPWLDPSGAVAQSVRKAAKLVEPGVLGFLHGGQQLTNSAVKIASDLLSTQADSPQKQRYLRELEIARAKPNELLATKPAEGSLGSFTAYASENLPTLLTAGAGKGLAVANRLLGGALDYGEGKSLEGIVTGAVLPGNSLAMNTVTPALTDNLATLSRAARTRLSSLLGLEQRPKQQTR